MDPVQVNLPIHKHPMTPSRDGRMGDCCGIKFEAITDGYYCTKCDRFFHKSCCNAPNEISILCCDHVTSLETCYYTYGRTCEFCGEKVPCGVQYYACNECNIGVCFCCATYKSRNVTNVPQNHDHELKKEWEESCFTCAACGKDGDKYSYKCHKCDLTFHVKCGKYEAEVNHTSHSLHPLKFFFGEPPVYTDGKCSLCGKVPVGGVFYHCSTCNFTLDTVCAFNYKYYGY